MTSFAPDISIFDIHLILLTITSYLTPREIEICQSVSKTWRSSFCPFQRIQAQWRSSLTLADQERLLCQCANIWTLSIPLDDPISHLLLKSGRLSNVRELTGLGRGRYKDLNGPQWSQTCPSSDWDVVGSNVYYDLPGAIGQLLETAVRLTFLKIDYEDAALLSSHQQFSGNMLRALYQHQALTTILLNFPRGFDWSGVKAALHSLPDTIETLEINGIGQWANLRTERPLETIVRIEPYLQLRRVRFGKTFGQTQLLTGLLPFLQLCPHLQEFRLEMTRFRSWCERVVADTLLEHCLDINDLDLRYWETTEQMRLVRGYAFKALRVCDFILRDPATIEGESPAGPCTVPWPMDVRPRTIPSLVRSRDTLELLELESSHCWTPYHDFDLVLSQFPNLKELTMDRFDFQQQDRDSPSYESGCMATKIEKLKLVIHERPTYEQNQDAIDFCSMKSLPLLIPEEEMGGGEEEDEDHYDRRNEWYFRDLFGILDLDVPPTKRQSTVTLAGGILQLYDQLALLSRLQDLNVIWYIYRSPDAVLDSEGNLDVRGPLQVELQRQGMNRASLQRLNLRWTEYPTHDEDKEQEVDPKLKQRGFVLTDMEAAPRRSRDCEEHVRAGMTTVTRSAAIMRVSYADDDMEEEEDARALFKSRNKLRTKLARQERQRNKL